MIIAKEIVHRVLLDQDASEFTAAGVTETWAHDPQMAGLFGAEPKYANAFRYVFAHIRQHGCTPSMELFRKNFPEGGFRFTREPPRPSELLEEAGYGRKLQLIATTIQGLGDRWSDLPGSDGDRQLIDQMAGQITTAASTLQTVAASGKQKYRVLTTAQLKATPPPEYLIEDLLEAGAVTLLFGPSGHAKSFTTGSMVTSVGTGTPFLGEFKVVQGHSIYVCGENHTPMNPRVQAWEREYGLEVPDGAISWVAAPVRLDDDGTAFLCQMVRERDAKLVVIDTVAKCIGGMKENDAGEMGAVMDRLGAIRDARYQFGTTVLAVHHPPKSNPDGGRGSDRFFADADAVLTQRAPGTTPDVHQSIHLTVRKAKNGASDTSWNLRLRHVEVPGFPLGSCVLEEAPDIDGPDAGKPRRPAKPKGSGKKQANVQKIRAWVQEKGWFRAGKLYEGAEIAKSTGAPIVSELEKAGKLEKRGEGSATEYRLNPDYQDWDDSPVTGATVLDLPYRKVTRRRQVVTET